jgi:hypothetical protein
MRKISIIPFVLSIVGLIACGIAIGFATKDLSHGFDLESFIMAFFAVGLFVYLLFLSMSSKIK